MKVNVLLLFLVICLIISCNENDAGKVHQSMYLPEPYHNNDKPNNSARINSTGQYTWTTGRIETVTIWGDTDQQEHPSGHIHVPDEYVIIGGGAETRNVDAGAFLTESRPDFDNNDWYAASKSHIDSDVHYIRIFATGIKLTGISALTLRTFMTHYESPPSSLLSLPSNQASVSNGYRITGGGAKVNWSGWGNMLVESYPSGPNSWRVSSKDHIYQSSATIIAYAIGIQENIPGFGSLNIFTLTSPGTTVNSGWCDTGIYTVDYVPNYVLACVGGRQTYSGYGRMLGILYPRGTYYPYVKSKDHKRASSGTLYRYEININEN